MISKAEHGRRRFEELKLRKQRIGDRHTRKIEKFSDRFNSIFLFFLKSYRKGILTFAGVGVDVEFDINSYCARGTFRRFDDGQYKNKVIISRHSNVTKAVIVAKKSWGLHLKLWSDGVKEGSFRRQEIEDLFLSNGIEIPEAFLKEFYNLIYKVDRINPFIQMINDKKIINESIKEGKTIEQIAKENSDIKFIHPI